MAPGADLMCVVSSCGCRT